MLTSLDQDEEVAKQACQLLDSINAQWREGEKLKLAHQRQELDRGLVQMLQQQLTSHSWVHHDAHVGINSPTPCGLFMINLNQSLSVLLSQSPLLTDIHHQITQLANQVEQRLKWAAGANPNLLQVIKKFSLLAFYGSSSTLSYFRFYKISSQFRQSALSTYRNIQR
jgi:hypothetical protein